MILTTYAPADGGIMARNGLTVQDVRPMLGLLGVREHLGDEFPCVLPDAPPGGLAAVEATTLRYQVLYSGRKEWWSLAEVFASQTAGRPVTFSGRDQAGSPATHAAWWRRLRHGAGLLDVEVPALDLPDRLSPVALRVAHGFALAYTLNDYQHPGEPVAFSHRFGETWCGLGRHYVGPAIRELVAAGVLVPVGGVGNGQMRTATYRLGHVEVSTTTIAKEAVLA